MKKILLTFGIVLLICSSVNAQVLLTALPMGAGKIGVAGALGGTYSQNTNSPAYSLGGIIGYGATNDLDVYLKLGYAATINLPATTDYANLSAIGLAAKYSIIKEGSNIPVSVAGAAMYSSGTAYASLLGGAIKGQAVAGDLELGLIMSKVFVPFVPYFAFGSHFVSSNSAFTASSQTQNWEAALGTYMFLSRNNALIAEWSTSMRIDLSASNTISLGYTQSI